MYHHSGNINVIVTKQHDKEALSRLRNEVSENYEMGTKQDFCTYPYDRENPVWLCNYRMDSKGCARRGEGFSMGTFCLFVPDFTTAILF